ncbi:MAG: DUF5104 domain-containing protein, partial [Lachnospiraceae bacterium]|nr:DUF5104 domain-containing protein [Lachnospiraceae bacterium]
DGDIISIDRVVGYHSGGSTDEYGDSRYNFAVELCTVKTNSNKEYDVGLYGIYYSRSHPEKEGVNYIYVTDKNEKKSPDDMLLIGLKF